MTTNKHKDKNETLLHHHGGPYDGGLHEINGIKDDMAIRFNIDGMKPQEYRGAVLRTGDYTLPLPVFLSAEGEALALTTEKELPSLEELQRAVGGYIEFVPIPAMDDIVLVVDEEGLLKEKPYNKIASEIAGRVIVGDVVITLREEAENEQ